MKTGWITKATTLTLIASMLLASCGDQGSNSSSSSSSGSKTASSTGSSSESKAENSDTAQDGAYALPIVEPGSMTISISSPENKVKGYSYTDDLPVWKKLMDETGFKIDWRVTPSSDYNNVIQTQLAAGVDLADFIDVPDGAPMKYVNDGLIVPITEQLEKNGYYTRQFFEANPYVKPFVTGTDGEIYFFTSDTAGSYLTDPESIMIREDWLKKFNLEKPSTLDDWYNCWKTFLDSDANGNGQKDEIPFIGDPVTSCFGNAFGLNTDLSSDGWYVDANGTVQYGYVQPAMKDLLTWASKCFSEGLIDKTYATPNNETTSKNISLGLVGSTGGLVNYIATYNKMLADYDANAKYVAVPLPKLTADAPATISPVGGPTVLTWGFSKDCKNLDEKFKFIDYCYASQSGVYGMNFGVEGQSYEMKDGLPAYTDYALKNPDMGMNAVIRSLGGMPYFPFNRSLNGYWSHGVLQFNQEDPALIAAYELYQPNLTQAFPRRMLLSEEEQAVMGQYLTDIETHVKEMRVKFVMGQESLDRFDKFVNNLNSMGLDKVTAVRQAQYDRYMEAQK